MEDNINGSDELQKQNSDVDEIDKSECMDPDNSNVDNDNVNADNSIVTSDNNDNLDLDKRKGHDEAYVVRKTRHSTRRKTDSVSFDLINDGTVCCAVGCSHKGSRKSCKLLSFPKDLEWRRRWVFSMLRCYINADGTPDQSRLWEPGTQVKLCECHFSMPIDVHRRKEESRHIMPDLFDLPDTDEPNELDKWRLNVESDQVYSFSQEYVEANTTKKETKKHKKDKEEKNKRNSDGKPIKTKSTPTKQPKIESDVSKKGSPLPRYWTVCSAIGCQHKIYEKTCSFVAFPKVPEWRLKWSLALQRCHMDPETGSPDYTRLWDPEPHMKLCTCHFSVPINVKTRKLDYNHVFPDIVTFPPESELTEDRDVWKKNRVIMKDEWMQKLRYFQMEADVMKVAQSTGNQNIPNMENLSSTSESGTSSQKLFGLLTNSPLKLEQSSGVTSHDLLANSAYMSGQSSAKFDLDVPAELTPVKYPLFAKYHSSLTNVESFQIETDTDWKQYINHCSSVNCKHKIETDTDWKQYINHCSAVTCKHRISQKLCSFISFPKAPEWRSKWVKAMRRCYVDKHGREDKTRLWEPKDYHRLCTCHFSVPVNTKTRKTGYNHILPDIFSFPDETPPQPDTPSTDKLTNYSTTPSSAVRDSSRLSGLRSLITGIKKEEETRDSSSDGTQSEAEMESILVGTIEIVPRPEREKRITQGTKRKHQVPEREPIKAKEGDLGHNSCAVPTCSHKMSEKFCSFVSFPKIKDLRRKWVESMQHYEKNRFGENVLWEPSDQHKICVCHFSTPINVRSRAPGQKLIVPDIIDTSSFIPVPTSKPLAGNRSIVTLKRVPAHLVTLSDIQSWSSQAMEMFVMKNQQLSMSNNRESSVKEAWEYVQQKRNESPESVPSNFNNISQHSAIKKQKLEHPVPVEMHLNSNISTTDDMISKIVQNVMTDMNCAGSLHNGINFMPGINGAGNLHNGISSVKSELTKDGNFPSIIEPVGYIDMGSFSSTSDAPSQNMNSNSPRNLVSILRPNLQTASDKTGTSTFNSLKSLLTMGKGQQVHVTGENGMIKDNEPKIKGSTPEVSNKANLSLLKSFLNQPSIIQKENNESVSSNSQNKCDSFDESSKTVTKEQKQVNGSKVKGNGPKDVQTDNGSHLNNLLLKSLFNEPSIVQTEISKSLLNSQRTSDNGQKTVQNNQFIFQTESLGNNNSELQDTVVTIPPAFADAEESGESEHSIDLREFVDISDPVLDDVYGNESKVKDDDSDKHMCRECGDTFNTDTELNEHSC